MSPCRGRRRGRRWISKVPSVRSLLPEDCPRVEGVSIIWRRHLPARS
ncbi:MAG: hypothetical protein IPI63_00240 [Methanothrix sp.]|nr:hypothetical protein [Methanothrix sp.]MBK7385226.1 hypothetical protein [Methanothrix sp.]HPW73298.1 hypothetical protein [Methanothrix sp.]